MKAATIHPQTGAIHYADVPAPVVTADNNVVLTVRAAALKHLDHSRASGQHYSSEEATAETIIGSDGVGLLPDGTRVYALNPDGMMAEQVLVDKNRMVVVPDGLDDATAAALPNAVIGSAMALRFRAHMQPGETVLINGATGVTGRIAVQIARHYGAKKIIATGRNPRALQELSALGANELILIDQDETTYLNQLRTLHRQTPVDVIIDYLWGQPAQLLLAALQGKGGFTHPVRFVTVGSMAGTMIQLDSGLLRGTNLYLSGSGLGSWTRSEVNTLLREILPDMFRLATEGKLHIDTVSRPLHAIEQLAAQPIAAGKRLVITIP